MENDYPSFRTDSRLVPHACWLIFLAAAFCAGGGNLAAAENPGPPRLTYTRVLEGSVPEYISIIVDRDGTGTYEGRKLADTPRPLAMKISPATVERLFGLAASLNYFQSIDLESHKNVANLGLKTLTYESNGQKSSAEFNYTVRREARELSELFEKISSVEEHLESLRYAIKYDHLSLPRELQRIQIDLRNQSLAEPELLVPALKEIEGNPRFLHLAKVRAQDILAAVQNSN
jgi:hypothetical protein